MEYNTEQPNLLMPEYGRNVQKMIEYCLTLEDKIKRNEQANVIISVMGNLNPHLRGLEFRHKLWDHLFIMSDFNLDVESPYPMPTKETFLEKPQRMLYPGTKLRFKHYGRTVMLLVEKATTLEDGPEKEHLITAVAKQMKKLFLTWSLNSVTDKTIWKQMDIMADGKLKLDLETPINVVVKRNFKKPHRNQSNRNQGGRNQNRNQNRNQKRN